MEIQDFGYGIVVKSDTLSAVVYVDDKAVKKFKGESAWANAERFASDIALKKIYG